jgi:hypothetical protein
VESFEEQKKDSAAKALHNFVLIKLLYCEIATQLIKEK